jgi:thioredoxin-like negative regulator of GroEL
VLALHSFFYDEALDEFRAAQKLAPGFAMAYWGEAMALNQTFWQIQDTEGARKVLAAIPADVKVTAKERELVDAVRALYGEGDKRARDGAYAQAMERLARKYPDDDEVQSLYALSLIGIVRPDEPGLATRMRAGPLPSRCWRATPSTRARRTT